MYFELLAKLILNTNDVRNQDDGDISCHIILIYLYIIVYFLSEFYQ